MSARKVTGASAVLKDTTAATIRRMVLWVPDWPVVAAMTQAGLSAELPAAVLHGKGLLAVSAAARAAGVKRGMRQRLARRACPELLILPHDNARDARLFEAVAAAAEQVVSGVEISRPGVLMIPSDGAARYHGSEQALAEALVTAIAEHAGCEARVGCADGLLAAVIAARNHDIVPAEGSAAYLAPQPIDALLAAAMESEQQRAVTALVDVLLRLGIVHLGDLTALPGADVLARFGPVGAWAQRMARGEDVAPPVLRRAESDIAITYTFEDPAHNIEQLTAVAAVAAGQLDQALLQAGSRCSKVRISARTTSGAELVRVWRTDVGVRSGAFAKHMTDRVRWQLEGWLSGSSLNSGSSLKSASEPEPAPLTELTLTAEAVVALGDEQAYLWGASSGPTAKAHRTIERLQGLLGLDGVLAPKEQGGRTPRDRIHLGAWGQEGLSIRPLAPPWPGKIPDPSPATVLSVPVEVQVLDAGGSPVRVDARLAMSAPPTWLRFQADPRDKVARAAHRHPSSGHVGGTDGPVWDVPLPVQSWAGPWPVVERWWSQDSQRAVYLQLCLQAASGDQEMAVLVALSHGRWMVDGVYD